MKVQIPQQIKEEVDDYVKLIAKSAREVYDKKDGGGKLTNKY